MPRPSPTLVRHGTAPIQRWDDPRRGRVAFATLVEGGGLVQGLARFAPGDREARHSHDIPETVHVVEGAGAAELGDRLEPLWRGDTVQVPAGLVHAWAAPDGPMTLLYTFPADRFADIAYRWDRA